MSEGRIINAATADLTLLDFGHCFLMHILFEPFVLSFYLVLLVWLVGSSVIWGVSLLILLVISPLLCSKFLRKLRAKTSLFAHARLKLLYDVISGIRGLKSYVWEGYVLGKLTKLRNSEQRYLTFHRYLKFSSFSILRYGGYIAAGIVFSLKREDGETGGAMFFALTLLSFMSMYSVFFLGLGIQTFG